MKALPILTSVLITLIAKLAIKESEKYAAKSTRAMIVPSMVNSYADGRFLSARVIGSKTMIMKSEKPFDMPRTVSVH